MTHFVDSQSDAHLSPSCILKHSPFFVEKGRFKNMGNKQSLQTNVKHSSCWVIRNNKKLRCKMSQDCLYFSSQRILDLSQMCLYWAAALTVWISLPDWRRCIWGNPEIQRMHRPPVSHCRIWQNSFKASMFYNPSNVAVTMTEEGCTDQSWWGLAPCKIQTTCFQIGQELDVICNDLCGM